VRCRVANAALEKNPPDPFAEEFRLDPCQESCPDACSAVTGHDDKIAQYRENLGASRLLDLDHGESG